MTSASGRGIGVSVTMQANGVGRLLDASACIQRAFKGDRVFAVVIGSRAAFLVAACHVPTFPFVAAG